MTTPAVPPTPTSADPGPGAAVGFRRRAVRAAILLAGLLACQFAVLGSSLWGATYLLPLDILGEGTNYLPRPTGPGPRPEAKDPLRSDLVDAIEPWRRFVVDEVRAGRLPLWNPYNYCGHPLLAANQPGVFSPYRLLDYAWPSPVAVAWSAVLRALVAGVGAYLFFRRAMAVSVLPALVGGWCFPLSGTLVLSGGYPGAAVVTFLPWVLLAADAVARRPGRTSVAALAVAVVCPLLAGHAAFAGQVLLAGGVYFLARVASVTVMAPGGRLSRGQGPRGMAGRLALGGVGVAVGFCLAAPQLLPTVDYLRSSRRIAMRQAGQVEAPSAGPGGLVQMALPFGYGSSQRAADYVRYESNWIESPAGGYAGLVVALGLAPLAVADPRRRRWVWFWAGLAVLAASPALGIPGLEILFQVGPVSLLRNNRLVFVAGFAVLSLGVLGLDTLVVRPAALRSWAGRRAVAAGLGLAAVVGATSAIRADDPTGVVPSAIPWLAVAGDPLAVVWPDRWEASAAGRPAAWFGLMYLNGIVWSAAVVAALGAVAWRLRATGGRRPAVGSVTEPSGRAEAASPADLSSFRLRWVSWLLAATAVFEMAGFAGGVCVTADPRLYYPRLAWMDAVAAGVPGRICGVDCLPANVSLVHRLADVRGYDGSDPTPIVDLIREAQTTSAAAAASPDAAIVRFLAVDPAHPGPVARLLGVRYYVGRGDPPAGVTASWRGQDYWVATNPGALPRATVPRHLRVVPAAADRLRLLASAGHDPAEVALLESELPTKVGGEKTNGGAAGISDVDGSVTIDEDLPGRVRLRVDLKRPGLVRLADAWDAGWQATYNGQPVDVRRVDHTLLGVAVPAGQGVVEFRYAPASFQWGLILAGAGATVLVGLLLPWHRWTSKSHFL